MSKPSKTVEVYRPGAPTTRKRVKDVRLKTIQRHEAVYLVRTLQLATWRGREHNAITTTLSTKALLMFIGLMRYQERAPMCGADSKTFSAQGPNPWKGVRHVRNESYTVEADWLMETVHAVDEETRRDPYEALFRSLLSGLRGGGRQKREAPEPLRLRFPYQPEVAA